MTLLHQTVTIDHLTDGDADELGNPTRTVSSSTTLDGYLEQLASTEFLVDQDTRVTTWRLVLPAGTAIDARDRVTVAGVAFEVRGRPARPVSGRTGEEHHVEAYLIEVEG